MNNRVILLCGLLFSLFTGKPVYGADELDSITTQIIWFAEERVYFNAGVSAGITPGWSFRLQSDSTGDSTGCFGVIDQVYPDVSSAPAPVGGLPTLGFDSLAGLSEVWLYPPESAVLHLPHLRIGIVNREQPLDRLVDLLNFLIPASIMWPWTRSGELADPHEAGVFASLMTPEGRHWTVGLDTTGWPEGEFPRSWGALVDRLNGIIDDNEKTGCPTLWALRPRKNDPLDRDGVLFEGFFYVNDTTVGLEYTTAFYTFAEYTTLGRWRRAVVAAAAFDSELDTRPPGWLKAGRHSWVRNIQHVDGRSSPFLIDTITVLPYADYSDQWLALELGEVDLCSISIDDILRGPVPRPEYSASSAVQNAIVVFGVNQQKDDLSDNRLTTAVCYLVDKHLLARALLAGQGIVAHAIMPDKDPLTEAHYPFDPRKGRRILKDLRLRRTLNFYVDNRIDRGKTVAEHIAGKLAAEGIKTRLILTDHKQFADPDYVNSMDIFLYYWPVSSERPDVTFYPFLYYPATRCGTNPLALDDPEFLNLVENARREESRATRKRHYREIEYRLLTEPYICPLYRPITSIVGAKQLSGIRLTADGEIDIVVSETVNETREVGR